MVCGRIAVPVATAISPSCYHSLSILVFPARCGRAGRPDSTALQVDNNGRRRFRDTLWQRPLPVSLARRRVFWRGISLIAARDMRGNTKLLTAKPANRSNTPELLNTDWLTEGMPGRIVN
jgi:hypothetical protein